MRFFGDTSLAWADLYLALANLAPRFDFEFMDICAEDLGMISDNFVIGTKARSRLICGIPHAEI